MNEEHIQASLFVYVNATHSKAPARWSDPEKFDPVAEDLQSYYLISLDNLGGQPRRKSQTKRIDVRVVANCYARTSGNIHGSLKEARQLADVLEHAEVPIYDYDDSAEPQVGTIRLGEAQITEETSEDSQWQRHIVTVEGVAQGST